MRSPLPILALALAAMVACDDDPDPIVDAAIDAAPDLAVDAADGTGYDVGPGPDAAPDAQVHPDAAPDARIDPDAAPDAMPDAIVDAMPDAIVDAMPDAMPDMAPDMMPLDPCDHPRSECHADADCPGGRCGQLPDAAGAACYCIGPRPEAQRAFCDGGGGGPFESECCADADCAAPPDGLAVCQQSVYGAQNEYCGGAAPPEENACRTDECAADVDCAPSELCVPAGAFGFVYNACRPADCRVDADCALRPGGECRPYFTRCVSGRFGCSYADDPCRVDADCPVGRFGDQERCVPGPMGTTCQEFLPAP